MAVEVVIAVELDDDFPLRVWQTGSGTVTSMNGNDHANCSLPSNDAFPTAMHVASAEILVRELLPAVAALRDAPAALAGEFEGYVAQRDDLGIEQRRKPWPPARR